MTNLASICGLLGTGKTLFMTLIGLTDKLNYGLNIKSNYWTDFSEKINPLDLTNFELEDCTVLIDEGHTIFDSRNSSSPLNKLFGYFFAQSRKKGVNIIITSQLLSSVEKRIRELVPYYYKALPRNEFDDFTILQYYGNTDIETGLVYKLKYNDMDKYMFHRYNTEEVIIPMIINEDVINLDLIIKDFEACVNKKTFERLIVKTYPQLVQEDIGACFDFLKKDDVKRAKRVLIGKP